MFWTALAMLLLVVTGGFISYYGDLQGRRWGKKRISWFGMRPKHTAILITSLTGGVIAFLSVGVLMLVVPQVRDVVLKGEQAIKDNQRNSENYKRDIAGVQANLKKTSAQVATEQAAIEEYNKQEARAKQEIGKLQATNSGLEKRNSGLISTNMDLQQQRAALDRSIQQKQREVIEKTKQNEAAEYINSQIARQNTNLGRENDNLTHERARLLASNETLRGTNRKLKDDNDQLSVKNAQLTFQFAAADKAYNGILDENKEQQDKNNDLTKKNALLKMQIDDLNQQREDLSHELAGTSRDFVRAYMELRQTRYNLRADTELARRTLDAHLSPKAVKEELMGLMRDASDRARQFGAVLGENGRAVAIVKKRVITPASIQMTDESASIDAIVDAVAGSNTPVVVIARTINNSAAHEQVLIELSSYTSQTVFKQGEVVASRTIDASQSIDKVVNSVIGFLREDVRNAAIKSGTIPQISPENGDEEVGMIDTPEMVTLVDRIRRMGGTVLLTAVANDSITSADLLTFGQMRGGKPHNLRFDLKRVRGKARRSVDAAGG